MGKTTSAAAMGMRSAAEGLRTLVISTDPAPSLGNAFARRLGPVPRAIRGRRRLHAVEIDAAAALDRWLAARRATFEEIVLRGTWLDRQDVSTLLRLALPGIDEVAALFEIAALGARLSYDAVIVDTAPTGHLLRMLEMPGLLQGLAGTLDRMQTPHRRVVAALKGRWTPDAADLLIEEIRRDAESIFDLLRDPARARLSWVTLAEPMAVEETGDALRWLAQHGIAVDSVIVNRVTPAPPAACRWCAGRRDLERRAIGDLRPSLPSSVRIVCIPAVEREPRGVSALDSIGRMMEQPWRASRRGGTTPRTRVRFGLPADPVAVPADVLIARATRLVMFGGKGGVGKTTCAAAFALDLARNSDTRILLLSADPAHSVADAVGQPVTDVARPLQKGPPNLLVRELDAARVFAGLREQFARAVDELFVRDGDDRLPEHDRRIVRDLLELAPPGVDEIVAVLEVVETLGLARDGQPACDLIVLDTAPTGHALRLIEMPSIVHEWVKALMAILLKYEAVTGIGRPGSLLLRLSRELGRLRDIMTDPEQTRFVVVTHGAAIPTAETLRLLRRLARASISAQAVIVNAVGAGTCSRCRASAAAQRREIAALRRSLPAQKVGTLVLAPAEIPPPHGLAPLRAWRKSWRRTPIGAGTEALRVLAI